MKRFLKILLLLLAINGMLKAQNRLIVDDVECPQDGESTLSVKCQFDVENICTAYSFSIVLPDELEFVMKEGTEVAFIKGNCHDESHVIMSHLSEGQLKMACLSLSSKPLSGGGHFVVFYR